MVKRLLQGVVVVALLSGGMAQAQLLIAVDEFGNGIGTVGRGFIGNGAPFSPEIEPGGGPDLPIAAQQPFALEQRQRQQPGKIFRVDL